MTALLERPPEEDRPLPWPDATRVKLRGNHRIVSMAVMAAMMVAVAVRTDGRREMPGIAAMPSEAEIFWSDALRSLTLRGLRGVQVVTGAAHKGPKAAAGKGPGAGWQGCRVHVQRNLPARPGKTGKPMASAAVMTVLAGKGRDHAHARWREVADSLRGRFRGVTEPMEQAEHDVLACMALDETLRARLHGTNPPERADKEIGRRTDAVGIFLDREAVHPLAGVLLPEGTTSGPSASAPCRRKSRAASATPTSRRQ
ncbi:hypothetical protein LNKW23_45720 [Paralimibaculum aggregatum]|uniref:Mutator family transposase n=1 Tax=Paralimibaculum aggregatum TaxID=3036245 RepID=A0ABQ6LTE1_9RHOB|nr:transposase [Limibaculum sp. NKW23]GMG85352.1 hypothetical protein LNKW23_45720 [Limibaculum sp. NKW23]